MLRRNWRRGVVLNLNMKRSLLATAGAVALCGLVPAAADATIIELGATTTPLVAPACPAGRAALAMHDHPDPGDRARDDQGQHRLPDDGQAAGRVVAFTVGLSSLSTNANTAKSDVQFLDKTYGGDAQVGITVLKRVGKKNTWTWQVVGPEPDRRRPALPRTGRAVPAHHEHSRRARRDDRPDHAHLGAGPHDRPLDRSLRLSPEPRRGTATTRPRPARRRSRSAEASPYSCDYPGTRVEYSATEVTNAVPTTTTTTTTTTKKK